MKKLKECIKILETLTEQGFIEYRIQDVAPHVHKMFNFLFALGIIGMPRTVSGSYGAPISDPFRAHILKELLRCLTEWGGEE